MIIRLLKAVTVFVGVLGLAVIVYILAGYHDLRCGDPCCSGCRS